eukprot:tig00020710_g13358.t2
MLSPPDTARPNSRRVVRPSPSESTEVFAVDSLVPRPQSNANLRPLATHESDPSLALADFAQILGIDPLREKNLMWIADEALSEPLPAGWSEHKTADNVVYFYHERTDESTFESPVEAKYRTILTTLRKLEGVRFAREQGALTNTTGSTAGASKKKRNSVVPQPPKSDADVFLPREVGPLRMSDVVQMGLYLSVDLKKEPYLARIVRDSVLAGIPQQWLELRDIDGEAYFYNRDSGACGREHPGDGFFRQEIARERSRPHPADETYWVEMRTLRNLKYSHDFASDTSRFDPSDEVARKSATAIAAVFKAGKARTERRVTLDTRGRANSTAIQCAFRMHRARRQYWELLRKTPRYAAAVKVQAVVRRYRTRILAKVARAAKKAAEEEAARVLAEAALAQKLYVEQLAEQKRKGDAAARPIQAVCRRRIARKRLAERRTGRRDEAWPICSALVLECADAAVWQSDDRAKEFQDAAERRAEEQRRALLVYGAARTIQAVYRRRLAVVEKRDGLEEARISKLERAKTAANNRRAAAATVRAAWLAALAREERRRLKKDHADRSDRARRFKAATKLQAVQRRHAAKMEHARLRYQHLSACAAKVQAAVRRRLARRALQRHREAMLDVMRADGSRVAKVVTMQSAVRRRIARNRLRKLRLRAERSGPKGASVLMQAAWRAYAARSALRRFRITVGAIRMQASARAIQGAWREYAEARDRRLAEERTAATRALAEGSMYTVVNEGEPKPPSKPPSFGGSSRPHSRGSAAGGGTATAAVIVNGLPRDRSMRRTSSSISAAEESVERLLDERHLTGVMGVRELASVVNSAPPSPDGSEGRVQGVLARNAWNSGAHGPGPMAQSQSQQQLLPPVSESQQMQAPPRKMSHTETGEGVSTITYYLNNGNIGPHVFMDEEDMWRGSPPRLLSVNNGPGDVLVRTADVDYPFRSDYVFSGYPGGGMYYGHAPLASKRSVKPMSRRPVPPPPQPAAGPAAPNSGTSLTAMGAALAPKQKRGPQPPKINSFKGPPSALLPALPAAKAGRHPIPHPPLTTSV